MVKVVHHIQKRAIIFQICLTRAYVLSGVNPNFGSDSQRVLLVHAIGYVGLVLHHNQLIFFALQVQGLIATGVQAYL